MLSGNSWGAVIMHGTRVIYNERDRGVSVRIENVGKQSALVQVWVDAGNLADTPDNSRSPFILRPPLFRLGAGRSQVLRMSLAGSKLPKDRESLYWLNVLEVPPRPDKSDIKFANYLQFSLRSRFKVIYRPHSLTAKDASKAVSTLTWRVKKKE